MLQWDIYVCLLGLYREFVVFSELMNDSGPRRLGGSAALRISDGALIGEEPLRSI